MKQELIAQRIEDLYALLGRHRIPMTDLCKEAGLPYASVQVNLRLQLKGVKAISVDRISQLEDAALKLREEKIQAA